MYNFIVVLGSNHVSQQHLLLYVSLDNRMHVKDLPFQVLTVFTLFLFNKINFRKQYQVNFIVLGT